MVQGTLGLIALFSLFIKWYCEKPRRLLKVWSLDVLKQGIAAVIAHFLNILFATILSNSTSDTATDQCAWYFINYGEAKDRPRFSITHHPRVHPSSRKGSPPPCTSTLARACWVTKVPTSRHQVPRSHVRARACHSQSHSAGHFQCSG